MEKYKGEVVLHHPIYAFKHVFVVCDQGKKLISPYVNQDQTKYIKTKELLPKIKGKLVFCRNGYHFYPYSAVKYYKRSILYKNTRIYLVEIPKGARIKTSQLHRDKFIASTFRFIEEMC